MLDSAVANESSVLFRCDASPELGFGHLVRCLALADQLRVRHGVSVGFVMRNGSLGFEMVQKRSYPVVQSLTKGDAFDYEHWLWDAVDDFDARALVVDVRDDLKRSTLAKLAKRGCLIAILDDLSDRRFAADLAFYAPAPQVKRADWTAFKGQRFVGWEWCPLRSEFSQLPGKKPQQTRSLLIAMGGSDPAGLTLQAARAVDLAVEDFEVSIVLGPGFRSKQSLKQILNNTRRQVTVHEDVTNMKALMVQADLAVCSFGMTAYELAATGVPAIYLCLTPDHAESASAFVNARIGWSLGMFRSVTDEQVAAAIDRLLLDAPLRETMSSRARLLIDGKGAIRTAEVLMDRVGKL